MTVWTVADLAASLMQLPDQDMPVELEGCDCTAPCIGIAIQSVVYQGEDVALLVREDGLWAEDRRNGA